MRTKLIMACSMLAIAGCSTFHERHAAYDNQNRYSSGYGLGKDTSTSNYQPGVSATTPSPAPGIVAQPPAQPTDNNYLVTKVQQQLKSDPALTALVPDLQIIAQNGTLTLAGKVPSEQEKQKIETTVKSTSGVVSVNNQLQISAQSQLNPATAPQNNAAVGGTAETTIASTAGATSSEATTTASQPTSPAPTTSEPANEQTQPTSPASSATPSPTSDRPDTSRTYNPAGTQPADESLRVSVRGTTEADRTLGQKIAQELRTDSSLAALLPLIKIQVETGKVTLRGNVKSEEQKKKIESAVQRVTGVATVEDQLQINTLNPQGATESKSQ